MWMPIHRKIPRTERFGVGLRIDHALIEVLATTRKAGFASGVQKIELLTEIIGLIDDVRFFFQILWETRLVSDAQYSFCAQKIEEIGREIGGWRKGLLAKTPPQTAREKKQKE